MISPRRVRFGFLLFPLLWLSLTSQAMEAVRFYQKVLHSPELGEVTCCALGWGAEEYAFLPPRDWRVKYAPAESQLLLQSSDHEASITLDLLPVGGARAVNPSPASLRQEVLRQYTNAVIREEFPCYTGASQGKGFEVAWVAFEKYPMCSRVAFVPVSGGTLRFVLTRKAEALAAYQPAFGSVLTSFHQTSSAK